MTAPVRLLRSADLAAVLELLEREPVHNLFLISRLRQYGLEPVLLGSEVYGFERDATLVAVCYRGANLVPAGEGGETIAAFAQAIGPTRRSSSIMGPSHLVMPLFTQLSQRWPTGWGNPREVRPRQPLMVIDQAPTTPGDDLVRRVRPDELDPYFAAAVAMYQEEVGVSPLDGTNSYRGYVARLIDAGRAFGVRLEDQFKFKSDIGSATGDYCQVQGVWLAPDLRGRRLSIPAMAQVVTLCQERHQVVSLYVNDFNTRARRLYEAVGFTTTGEFATVLY